MQIINEEEATTMTKTAAGGGATTLSKLTTLQGDSMQYYR